MMRIVVDCNNICHSVFHTVMKDLSVEEQKAGIIFGFLRQILSLSKKFKSNRFVFCWDSRKSYRKLIYPRYKANRQRNLTEIEIEERRLAYAQFDLLKKEILPKLGFKNVFMQVGYEADDLIAEVVYRFPDETVIVSTDHDLWQLLSRDKHNPVRIYNLRKKAIFDVSDFDKGCNELEPIYWSRVKAIAGCSSDNVKGIRGVGELTAIRYLTKNLREGKVKDRIESEEGRKTIERNIMLVALPFVHKRRINIAEISENEIFHRDKFIDVFDKYRFVSFLERDNFVRWEKCLNLV